MSLSVQLNGNQFLSSKEAAKIFGYSGDYISRLARQGKVTASRVGQQWFVDPTSLDKFLMDSAQQSSLRFQKLKVERKLERVEIDAIGTESNVVHSKNFDTNFSAHAISASVICAGFLIAFLPYISVPHFSLKNTLFLTSYELKISAYGVYRTLARGIPMDSELGASLAGRAVTRHVPEVAQVNNGIVVIPDSPHASTTIARIENSFSDRVTVTPSPGDSHTGFITPIFKNQKSVDRYRYVMVPVEHPP